MEYDNAGREHPTEDLFLGFLAVMCLSTPSLSRQVGGLIKFLYAMASSHKNI
jgi:hypothetical protein